jgi:hypothetical protein
VSNPVRVLFRAAIVTLALILAVPLGFLLFESARVWLFEAKFNRLYEGMSASEVIARLGQPTSKGKEFRLGQYVGFEPEYRHAAASRSKCYLFWHVADVVYAVGLNDEDRVVIASRGGT